MTFKFLRVQKSVRILSVLLTTAAGMALNLGGADAQSVNQPVRKKPSVQSNGPNYSYQAGPRTRVFVSKRSWLDPGTEVNPGERKFTDYAYAPGYNYGHNIDRLNQGRNPLSDNFDLGGGPMRFPLY